jgi:tRNA(adenine34) deaminase
MWTRRAAIAITTSAACGRLHNVALAASSSPSPINLDTIPRSVHEHFMRLAIAEARGNPRYPFGAVIARAADAKLMASGVNTTNLNPTFHGEIVAMNDYVSKHGNQGWDGMILYTTGEPCPMCMSALVWAGMGSVVYATSNAGISRAGIPQIEISSASVVHASAFYRGSLLGGVLSVETDQMFANRQRG